MRVTTIPRLQSSRNIYSTIYNRTTYRMSSNKSEAVDAAHSRAQAAAKSDDDTHAHAQGDLHESVQEASGENSASHASGSGMKDAGEKRHDESKEAINDKTGEAKDRVKGVGSSSS